MTAIFETEVCTRCGGSGEYSYCQTHGTTCFKCKGKKYSLTKRGEEAQRYLIELQTKSIDEVKVGDRIAVSGYKGTVLAIEPDTSVKDFADGEYKFNPDRISIKFEKMSVGTFKSFKVRVYPTSEENIQKALDYQNTLTKQGKVSKRK